MSQWKGPFKELYEKALQTGAKDIVKEAKSLREKFIEAAKEDGMSKKAAGKFYDSFIERLEAKRDNVVGDRPFDRGMLHRL